MPFKFQLFLKREHLPFLSPIKMINCLREVNTDKFQAFPEEPGLICSNLFAGNRVQGLNSNALPGELRYRNNRTTYPI